MAHINARSELDIWNLLGDQWTEEVTGLARTRDLNLDIQAIDWATRPISRDIFRARRIAQYESAFGVAPVPQNTIHAEPTVKTEYFDFLQHAQILNVPQHMTDYNLVWATTDEDIYLATNFNIHHWSNLTNTRQIAHESMQQGIKAFAVGCGHMVIVGREGELICKHIDTENVTTPANPYNVAKAADIYHHPSGTTRLMVTNQETGISMFNAAADGFQITDVHNLPWEVNHASVSPDGRTILVVGDSTEGRLIDSQTGQLIRHLRGHLDYYYASAWHPEGNIFATGNQDMSCRVWDIRRQGHPLVVLKGKIGAINALRFSSDGKFMAMAESADYVHIYDVERGFGSEQEIDFFGKTSGISFSPDTGSLFIGVSPCSTHDTSFLTYNRQRDIGYCSEDDGSEDEDAASVYLLEKGR